MTKLKKVKIHYQIKFESSWVELGIVTSIDPVTERPQAIGTRLKYDPNDLERFESMLKTVHKLFYRKYSREFGKEFDIEPLSVQDFSDIVTKIKQKV